MQRPTSTLRLIVVALLLMLPALWQPQSVLASRLQRTLSENFRMHRDFHSKFLGKGRDVIVWLPSGYDKETSKRYPVFYMLDGSNVFVNWRLDETAEKLIAANEVQQLIIVGIANDGTEGGRFDDYTPTPGPGGRGGKLDLYGRMLTEELKPFIDSEYRTLAGPPNTGLGGSSLGGLASLYLGLKYPATFGKLGVMSPSVWWDRALIVRSVKALKLKAEVRIWLDVGTAEGPTDLVKGLRDALVSKGWTLGSDLIYFEAKGARHDEAAWAQRSDRVLKYLFPK